MELMDVPPEVIDAFLLKFLPWNDLLRLRRVCRWTKGITDAYLRVHPNRAPEIEISEHGSEKTLDAFMDMGIPTTKLFLNNKSGYAFYEQIEQETERQFLENWGPLIKNLRVSQIMLHPFGREENFINGLKNLKSFEAGYFGFGRKSVRDKVSPSALAIANGIIAQKDRRLENHLLLPSIFKSLESIKIGQDDNFVKTVDIVTRSKHTFYACPQLKYACHPFDSTFEISEYEAGSLQHGALPRALSNVLFYVDERPNDLYPTEANGHLEFYDFENFHHENIPWTLESNQESFANLGMCWLGSEMFLQICTRALKTGLKLLNVNPTWFCARFKENFFGEFASPKLGIPVVSLVGLDPCVMKLDLPSLEKVTIPMTTGCVILERMRPAWPALKCLNITVDGKDGHVWDVAEQGSFGDVTKVLGQRTCSLWRFLFGNGIVHTNMNELCIEFVEGKGKKEVSVPKVEDIVASCPNLRKIKLGNWLGTNKQLVDLWKGLSGLEEISLENCKELGNVAFVGHAGNPVFLGLEQLQKLSLKGLDKMPKITDTLFCRVLSKMKLIELVVTSDESVEKVTRNALYALLGGPFAETIARFPFREWSLADMTTDEFQEMEKRFRSYSMI